MIEEWKDIAGYEGSYQVSNTGKVKSLARFRRSKGSGIAPVAEKLLTLNTDKDGYKEVALCKNNKLRYFRVHRLVATAFIPNPDGLPMINHKDENPANNYVENLEWCTNSYNISYSNYKVSHRVKCNGISYPSIRALSRAIGHDCKGIRHSLKTGRVFIGKYHITYE